MALSSRSTRRSNRFSVPAGGDVKYAPAQYFLEVYSVSVHTFTIRFNDGAHITRSEWGRSRKDALKTLRSIYGDTFEVVK